MIINNYEVRITNGGSVGYCDKMTTILIDNGLSMPPTITDTDDSWPHLEHLRAERICDEEDL